MFKCQCNRHNTCKCVWTGRGNFPCHAWCLSTDPWVCRCEPCRQIASCSNSLPWSTGKSFYSRTQKRKCHWLFISLVVQHATNFIILSFLKFSYLAFSTSDPHRPINIRTRSVNVFWSSCATCIIIKHRWNKRILIEINFMYNVGFKSTTVTWATHSNDSTSAIVKRCITKVHSTLRYFHFLFYVIHLNWSFYGMTLIWL